MKQLQVGQAQRKCTERRQGEDAVTVCGVLIDEILKLGARLVQGTRVNFGETRAHPRGTCVLSYSNFL